MFTALLGYTEDEHGKFGWGAHEDEEPHSYIDRHLPLRKENVRDNDLLGDGTHNIRPTEVRARLGSSVAGSREDRLLKDSRQATQRTIEREFDPDTVRQLKANSDHDITINGPYLGSHAIRARLVDEFQMIVCPAIGGGKRFIPDDVQLDLELVEERRFGNGVGGPAVRSPWLVVLSDTDKLQLKFKLIL